MDRRSFMTSAALTAWLLASGRVRATTYFTVDEVKAVLFPNASRFEDRSTTLDKAQMKAIKKASKTRGFSEKVHAFSAFDGDTPLGTLFIDQVYGKHEFITYAVALDAAHAVQGIEVMDYRETYGDEIRHPKWRAQFDGKKYGDPLEIDENIKNISGATLSCVHITEGVRRILATRSIAEI